MNAAMLLLTAVIAIATAVGAWATTKYVRALNAPNVSAYFETDGSWVYLVLQNTGTDTAFATRFTLDLTQAELAEIFGPNPHGVRYIVYKDLGFLDHVVQLAPSQRIRHQWLFLPFVVRDQKPRPCLLTINYQDRWHKKLAALAPFDAGQFGTYDQAYVPKPDPSKVIGEALKSVDQRLDSIARMLKGGAA